MKMCPNSKAPNLGFDLMSEASHGLHSGFHGDHMFPVSVAKTMEALLMESPLGQTPEAEDNVLCEETPFEFSLTVHLSNLY